LPIKNKMVIESKGEKIFRIFLFTISSLMHLGFLFLGLFTIENNIEVTIVCILMSILMYLYSQMWRKNE